MRTNFLIVFLLLFLSIRLCYGDSTEKTEKPLWELGLMNSVFRFPDYKGSDESEVYALPLPYFIYRGEFLKSDKDGFKGVFIQTNHFESDISLAAYPPCSDNNRAREGMPDLGALFEMGPGINFYFNDRTSETPLFLSAALRGVFSIDFDSGLKTEYAGNNCCIKLVYQKDVFQEEKWFDFGISLGLYIADKKLNGYFYNVKNQYEVLPERPYYISSGGNAGAFFATSISYRINDTFSLRSYFRLDNIRNAVFNDSPLVKKDNTFLAGIALVWKISESKTRVTVD